MRWGAEITKSTDTAAPAAKAVRIQRMGMPANYKDGRGMFKPLMGTAVRALSGDPALGELMVMNYRAAPLDKRQRAMLDFAVKVTAEPWTLEEKDREALRQARVWRQDRIEVATAD